MTHPKQPKILEVRIPLKQYLSWISRRRAAIAQGIILQHDFIDYPVPTHMQIHQSIILYGLSSEDIKHWIKSDKRFTKPMHRNILVYLRMVRD